PSDLVELVEVLGADLLVAAGIADDEGGGRSAIRRSLECGAALESFERMVRAQGGRLGGGEALERAPDVLEWKAQAAGRLGFTDVREVGYAVRDLGGGRTVPGETIDMAVGIVWQRVAGDRVDAGDVLALVHHRGGRGLESALERLGRSVRIEEGGEAPLPLIVERVRPGA
ncbi:MAG: pyrimidine-nucleoside phosphorylase, partial [Planctomycetota bacterium]